MTVTNLPNQHSHSPFGKVLCYAPTGVLAGEAELRVVVLSDIHGNIEALEAVLADAQTVDQVWCLGDVVGYGPDPNACVEAVRELPGLCVTGNHDRAATRGEKLDVFNPEAREAVEWTANQLTSVNRLWLDELSERAVHEDFTCVHGSPRSPVMEYLFSNLAATQNLDYFETSYCLVGHTHFPVVFLAPVEDEGLCELRHTKPGVPLELGPRRLIANVGSVGQPRDGNPQAAYALLDLERLTLELCRVDYPVDRTQQKMRRAGLPVRLCERLSHGY